MPLYPLQGESILMFVATCQLKILTDIRVGRDEEIHHINMWDLLIAFVLRLYCSFPKIKNIVHIGFSRHNMAGWVGLSAEVLKIIPRLEHIALTEDYGEEKK